MPPELGKRYRDVVSGFVGVATGRADYLYTTSQIRLVAETGPAGDAKERWVEEAQVVEDSLPSAGFAP